MIETKLNEFRTEFGRVGGAVGSDTHNSNNHVNGSNSLGSLSLPPLVKAPSNSSNYNSASNKHDPTSNSSIASNNNSNITSNNNNLPSSSNLASNNNLASSNNNLTSSNNLASSNRSVPSGEIAPTKGATPIPNIGALSPLSMPARQGVVSRASDVLRRAQSAMIVEGGEERISPRSADASERAKLTASMS